MNEKLKRAPERSIVFIIFEPGADLFVAYRHELSCGHAVRRQKRHVGRLPCLACLDATQRQAG